MADAYDELINDYTQQKQKTQTDLNNLVNEKQNVLNTYEQTYQNQLTDYNNLMNQQQANIDTWANTQKETQQKQTDFNIGLINQNKQEAEKQTNAEIGNAYIDYQKGLNQFGGSAETLASQGLGGTGFAKNQDIAMNITYQNRVSSAKSALQKANTDYNNQIQQALLNNDAQLAEIALQQMQQSYQLALKGFEYKSSMENNRLNYIQSINDSYFSKTNTLQGRIDNYTSSIASAKAAKQQAAEQTRINNIKYSSSGSSKSSSSSVGNFTDTSTSSTSNNTKYAVNTPYYQGDYNKDAMTNGKVDPNKVFSNGYQPNNVNGTKVSKSGYTVAQIFGKGQVQGSTGANLDSQNVWKAGNKYYVWDGSQNQYIDVSGMIKNSLILFGGKGGKHF